MGVLKNKYYTQTADKWHGMETYEYANALDALFGVRGKLVDSVMLQALNTDNSIAKPTFLGHVFSPKDNDKDAADKYGDVKIKLIDDDGDFAYTRFEVDMNSGKGVGAAVFTYDKASGDLVAVYDGHILVIDMVQTGNTLTGVLDYDQLAQYVDHGNWNGKGSFGSELYHGDGNISSFVELNF